MHELRKYFKVGDHVKVVAGRYEGDTGMVVKMESSLAIVFSDLTMSEVGGGRGGNEAQFYYELLDSASLACPALSLTRPAPPAALKPPVHCHTPNPVLVSSFTSTAYPLLQLFPTSLPIAFPVKWSSHLSSPSLPSPPCSVESASKGPPVVQ